jgi:hypothetical protein
VWVGLVLAARVQQPSSGRQRRGHVDDRLTGRDELLRQQRAMSGRTFHGPESRFERCRPREQPLALSTIGLHAQLADELFVAVDHRRGVRSLMGIDPNDEHQGLLASKWNTAAGTPDAGMPFLFRATPQHGNRQTVSSLGSQPESGRAFSRPIHQHPRRYETTATRDSNSTIRAF